MTINQARQWFTDDTQHLPDEELERYCAISELLSVIALETIPKPDLDKDYDKHQS